MHIRRIVLYIVLVFILVLVGCSSVPPLRDTIGNVENDNIRNAKNIFVDRMKIENNYGKLQIHTIYMISKQEVLINYVRAVTYDEKENDFKEKAVYMLDFSNKKINMLTGEEKSYYSKIINSNILNFRYIPPRTGEVVGNILLSISGLYNRHYIWTFDVSSNDRSEDRSFKLDKHTWNEKQGYGKYKYKVDYQNIRLTYNTNGVKHTVLLVPTMRTANNSGLPINKTLIQLSPDGKYLLLNRYLIQLESGQITTLFKNNSQILYFSVDPGWSKIAVLYYDDSEDGNPFYIGICNLYVD